MTICEANKKIKHLENLLDYWGTMKEIAFEKTQPKAVQLKDMVVQGGVKVENKVDKYVLEVEEIGTIIEETKKEMYALIRYVENELKRLEEYDPIARKVIMLREEKKMKWWKISQATNYSERQCKRIYYAYKKDGTQMARFL